MCVEFAKKSILNNNQLLTSHCNGNNKAMSWPSLPQMYSGFRSPSVREDIDSRSINFEPREVSFKIINNKNTKQ